MSMALAVAMSDPKRQRQRVCSRNSSPRDRERYSQVSAPQRLKARGSAADKASEISKTR